MTVQEFIRLLETLPTQVMSLPITLPAEHWDLPVRGVVIMGSGNSSEFPGGFVSITELLGPPVRVIGDVDPSKFEFPRRRPNRSR